VRPFNRVPRSQGTREEEKKRGKRTTTKLRSSKCIVRQRNRYGVDRIRRDRNQRDVASVTFVFGVATTTAVAAAAAAAAAAAVVAAVAVSFFPFRSFFPSLRPGLCVGAYEWGASLRDVTRGAGSRGESGCRGLERGGVAGVGGCGGTVRRWAVCGGYMTQHIDLSLVGW